MRHSASRSQMIGLLLSGAAALVLILWARRQMPLHRVVALYGLGGVAGAVRRRSARAGSSGWPCPPRSSCSGLLEEAGSGPRSRGRGDRARGSSACSTDYRSYFAFCLLAATLTVWQMRPTADETASRTAGGRRSSSAGMGIAVLPADVDADHRRGTSARRCRSVRRSRSRSRARCSPADGPSGRPRSS